MADAKVETTTSAPVEEKKDAAVAKKEEKIIVPNFISRIKITNSYTHGKITVREYDNISEISGASLIQGFPNPTSDNMITGIIITSYIVQHMKLPLVGDLISPNFPPMAVIKAGTPAPGARIYGNKNLVIISSEFTIKDAEILHDVVQATLEFAKRHKLSMIIGLDAVAGNLSETVNLLDQIQIQAENADELGEGGENDEDYEDDDGEDDAMDAVAEKVQVNELSAATMSAPRTQSLSLHTSDKKEASKITKKLGADKKKKDAKKSADADAKKDAKKASKKQDKASAEDEGDEGDDDEDEKEEKIDVWFVTNSQTIGDALKSLGMEPAIEAAINGVQGGLINEARFTDLQIVLMLASLDKLELGARPALVLVEAVQKLLTKLGGANLGIDLSKLQESTTSLESKIGEIMKKMQQSAPKSDDSKMNMLYM